MAQSPGTDAHPLCLLRQDLQVKVRPRGLHLTIPSGISHASGAWSRVWETQGVLTQSWNKKT